MERGYSGQEVLLGATTHAEGPLEDFLALGHLKSWLCVQPVARAVCHFTGLLFDPGGK